MSCAQSRTCACHAQVPLSGAEERIHDAIVERRAELAERDEVGAIRTVARMLAVLSEECDGLAPMLAGEHTPRYVRMQNAGERSYSLCDLVYRIQLHPELRRCLDPLLETHGEVRQSSTTCPEHALGTVAEELADVTASYAETLERWARAIADGELSRAEVHDLRPAVDRLIRQAVELRARLDRESEVAR